jgi:hypothetical protein
VSFARCKFGEKEIRRKACVSTVAVCYAAPRLDVPTAIPRKGCLMIPRPVRIAAWLLLASVAFTRIIFPVGAFVVQGIGSHESAPWDLIFGFGFFVMGLPSVLIATLLFFMLRRGYNWARIVCATLVIFFAVSSALGWHSLAANHLWKFLIYSIAEAAINLAAVALLFSKAGNSWFGKRAQAAIPAK